jgi:hypothetical protein
MRGLGLRLRLGMAGHSKTEQRGKQAGGHDSFQGGAA